MKSRPSAVVTAGERTALLYEHRRTCQENVSLTRPGVIDDRERAYQDVRADNGLRAAGLLQLHLALRELPFRLQLQPDPATRLIRLRRQSRFDDGVDELVACDVFARIFMPTTVHIPAALLKSVDRRAKALGLSRNRLVIRALEQAVSERSGWAPEFLEPLRNVDRETAAAVDELPSAVRQARRSKEPRHL